MKRIIFILSFWVTLHLFAQGDQSKFFLNIHTGINWNFDLNFSITSKYKPTYHKLLNDLIIIRASYYNPIGGSISAGLFYRIWDKSVLGISYSRSVHSGFADLKYTLPSYYNPEVVLKNARFTMITNTLEFVYKRNIKLKNNFYWELGGYFINPVSQGFSIEIADFYNSQVKVVNYDERTGFNAGFSFGFLAGVEKILVRSKTFELGFNTRVYYTLFDNYWEGMQFNIITRYNF